MVKMQLFLFLFLSLTGCSKIGVNNITKVDITGKWQDKEGFLPYIQTREPELKNGELKIFTQELSLPEGTYSILFEYEQAYDKSNGAAINNNFENFAGFKINGVVNNLSFHFDSTNKDVLMAERKITIMEAGKTLQLELAIHNTRVMRTWLTGNSLPSQNRKYFAVTPEQSRECLIINGIPFLARKTDIRQTWPWFSRIEPSVNADRGILKTWNNGMSFDLNGTKVKYLYFLGMIHQVDIANGSWYSPKGDHGYSHFIGDKAGDIIITFQNKEKTIIPLVFGFNLWYCRPWDVFWYYDWYSKNNYDSTLFCGDPEPRELIKNTLSLTDGMRIMGSRSNNTRFIFSLDLENKRVQSIEIKGVDDMYSHP